MTPDSCAVCLAGGWGDGRGACTCECERALRARRRSRRAPHGRRPAAPRGACALSSGDRAGFERGLIA